MKHAYAVQFGLRYDTEFRHDLYSPEILYEFKHFKNLHRRESRAAVLAQVMYYVRKLRLGHAGKPIPPTICIADRRNAFFTETSRWRKFYNNESKYDWDVAPSTPDRKLVADLMRHSGTDGLRVFDVQDQVDFGEFVEHLARHRSAQLRFDFLEKKLITEENFEDVFLLWNKSFGAAVRNGTKTSRYFLCDMQEGGSVYDANENKVVFNIGPDERRTKKILPAAYEGFWRDYERLSDPLAMRNILAKIDRLTEDPVRRFTGEFFTPVEFAKKAHTYLERVIGARWWTRGYRLWDMAAGTGNLEWFLPADSYEAIYLSSLHSEDVAHCQRAFPGATVFQYDYLNDDVDGSTDATSLFARDRKLPAKLQDDLADPGVKWIVLINPPFATAQKAGTSGGSKKAVADTAVRRLMHEDDLGEVSRELFAQFLFRIKRDFHSRTALLGLFSTLKYVNANNDQKFRDTVFQFAFKDGFIFSSANFSGTRKNNPFPVGFLVWDLAKERALEGQKIEVAVLDDDTSRIGRKRLVAEHRSRFLSKWIERVEATVILPPLGGAISVKAQNLDVRNRVAAGFLASLMCKGNDVQNYNNVALLSGPYVSAGALSVVSQNFEKAMIVHAVRRAVQKTWVNDRDQFLQPKRAPSKTFSHQCAVWSLFSGSNQTASLRGVAYGGKRYDLVNHLFPYPRAVLQAWKITDSDLLRSLKSDAEERFAANWLASQSLPAECVAVLELAREVYQVFFEQFKDLPTSKYKVEHWDAGWWQIRRCLADAGLATREMEKLDEACEAMRKEILEGAVALEMIASA